MTAGEKADGELLDHFFLANDDLLQLVAELDVNFAKLINGGDVVLRERRVGHGDFLGMLLHATRKEAF